jgi:hypothetical protein
VTVLASCCLRSRDRSLAISSTLSLLLATDFLPLTARAAAKGDVAVAPCGLQRPPAARKSRWSRVKACACGRPGWLIISTRRATRGLSVRKVNGCVDGDHGLM